MTDETTATIDSLLNRTQRALVARGLAEGWTMGAKVDPMAVRIRSAHAKGSKPRTTTRVTLTGEKRVRDGIVPEQSRTISWELRWDRQEVSIEVTTDKTRAWFRQASPTYRAPVTAVHKMMDDVLALEATS